MSRRGRPPKPKSRKHPSTTDPDDMPLIKLECFESSDMLSSPERTPSRSISTVSRPMSSPVPLPTPVVKHPKPGRRPSSSIIAKGSTGISGKRSSDGTSIVKGNWTDWEDMELTRLVLSSVGDGRGMKRDGKGIASTKWSEIAKALPGRVGKQCRERWHNHLRPDINKGRWTSVEEVVIYLCWKKWGTQWARIARVLEGRSDNRVKNHWNCHMYRRLQRDPPYTQFMDGCFGQFHSYVNEEDDEDDLPRFEALIPQIAGFINHNYEKVEKFPYMYSIKRQTKASMPGSSHTLPDYTMAPRTVAPKPTRPEKPAKKTKRTRKRGAPSQKNWSTQPEPMDMGRVEEENTYQYSAPVHHFYGGYHNVPTDQQYTVKQEPDVMNTMGSPNPLMDAHMDPHPFSSPYYQLSDMEPSSDEGLRSYSYGCDPLLSRAVTAEFSAGSPRYTHRVTRTSTPLKQNAAFNVPLASECGYSPASLAHNRSFGTYETSDYASPNRQSFHSAGLGGECSSIWTPAKQGCASTSHCEEIWSPLKLGVVVRTPQPIRDALARSGQKTFSPEDLASPGRLFSDASELIDTELNQSGDIVPTNRRLDFSFKDHTMRSPDAAVSRCRRRLSAQWSTPNTQQQSMNSSGYYSIQGTPL